MSAKLSPTLSPTLSIKLEKVIDPKVFRKQLLEWRRLQGPRGRQLDSPASNLYFVLIDDERIGYVDLQYPPGAELAKINQVYLHQAFRPRVDQGALYDLIADRARDLGARVIQGSHTGTPDEETPVGWSVEHVTYRISKSLD